MKSRSHQYTFGLHHHHWVPPSTDQRVQRLCSNHTLVQVRKKKLLSDIWNTLLYLTSFSDSIPMKSQDHCSAKAVVILSLWSSCYLLAIGMLRCIAFDGGKKICRSGYCVCVYSVCVCKYVCIFVSVDNSLHWRCLCLCGKGSGGDQFTLSPSHFQS